MCARCLELEEKIDLYRQLSAWVIDKETRRGIDLLIRKYRVDREELHPPNESAVRPGASDFRWRRSMPDAP
jgi:hypothetical protein